MQRISTIISVLLTATLAQFLVACQDSGLVSGNAALEDEIISLERTLDRLERATAANQRTIDRTLKRTNLAAKERQQRFDNDRALRSQVEILQSRVDTLNGEFAAYRENCQIGTLKLDGN